MAFWHTGLPLVPGGRSSSQVRAVTVWCSRTLRTLRMYALRARAAAVPTRGWCGRWAAWCWWSCCSARCCAAPSCRSARRAPAPRPCPAHALRSHSQRAGRAVREVHAMTLPAHRACCCGVALADCWTRSWRVKCGSGQGVAHSGQPCSTRASSPGSRGVRARACAQTRAVALLSQAAGLCDDDTRLQRVVPYLLVRDPPRNKHMAAARWPAARGRAGRGLAAPASRCKAEQLDVAFNRRPAHQWHFADWTARRGSERSHITNGQHVVMHSSCIGTVCSVYRHAPQPGMALACWCLPLARGTLLASHVGGASPRARRPAVADAGGRGGAGGALRGAALPRARAGHRGRAAAQRLQPLHRVRAARPGPPLAPCCQTTPCWPLQVQGAADSSVSGPTGEHLAAGCKHIMCTTCTMVKSSVAGGSRSAFGARRLGHRRGARAGTSCRRCRCCRRTARRRCAWSTRARSRRSRPPRTASCCACSTPRRRRRRRPRPRRPRRWPARWCACAGARVPAPSHRCLTWRAEGIG